MPLTGSSGLQPLVLLSRYASVAAPMIKVLCVSQVCGSLIDNLYRHHVLYEKFPGTLEYVT